MRIALVTTWRQPCGIATYSENLAAALRDRGHTVFVLAEDTTDERDDVPVDLSGILSERCWHRDSKAIDRLMTQIRALRPDVLHIQHEYGIFRQRAALFRLVREAWRICPVYLTPHTITGRAQHPALSTLWPALRSGRVRLIVHTRRGLDLLERDHGYPGNLIRWISHASPCPDDCVAAPRRDAREALGLPIDRVMLLSLGFIGEGKRQLATVEALTSLVEEGHIDPADVLYVIAGKPGGGWQMSGAYLETISRGIEDRGAGDYIRVIPEFVPFEMFPQWFGATDACVNLSVPTPASASGRCRIPAAYGVAQVLEAAAIHEDLAQHAAMVPLYDGDALKSTLARIVRDAAWRAELGEKGRQYAEGTTWAIQAGHHEDWYAAGMAAGRVA